MAVGVEVRKASRESFLEARAQLRRVILEELPHAGAVAEELAAEAEHATEEMGKELGFDDHGASGAQAVGAVGQEGNVAFLLGIWVWKR